MQAGQLRIFSDGTWNPGHCSTSQSRKNFELEPQVHLSQGQEPRVLGSRSPPANLGKLTQNILPCEVHPPLLGTPTLQGQDQFPSTFTASCMQFLVFAPFLE